MHNSPSSHGVRHKIQIQIRGLSPSRRDKGPLPRWNGTGVADVIRLRVDKTYLEKRFSQKVEPEVTRLEVPSHDSILRKMLNPFTLFGVLAFQARPTSATALSQPCPRYSPQLPKKQSWF